jgi:hypothetical protein
MTTDMTSPIVAYLVEMTEYERGWGSRPDGYLAFPTEADARAYVTRQTAGRSIHNVPDEYVAYSMVGYRDCSQRVIDIMQHSGRGFTYIDRLHELKT